MSINPGSEGFGPGMVPPEEFYVMKYTRRGNRWPNGEREPVFTSTRWGYGQYPHVDPGYITNQENPYFLAGNKQKKGDNGIYERVSYDTPELPGFGILAELNNSAIRTRGGPLRQGAGKRAAYYDRVQGEENIYPGYAPSPALLTNRNNATRWEPKRKERVIINDRAMDPTELSVLQHNPWFIPSHQFVQAMQTVRNELDGNDNIMSLQQIVQSTEVPLAQDDATMEYGTRGPVQLVANAAESDGLDDFVDDDKSLRRYFQY